MVNPKVMQALVDTNKLDELLGRAMRDREFSKATKAVSDSLIALRLALQLWNMEDLLREVLAKAPTDPGGIH